jgi:hypothetical protein
MSKQKLFVYSCHVLNYLLSCISCLNLVVVVCVVMDKYLFMWYDHESLLELSCLFIFVIIPWFDLSCPCVWSLKGIPHITKLCTLHSNARFNRCISLGGVSLYLHIVILIFSLWLSFVRTLTLLSPYTKKGEIVRVFYPLSYFWCSWHQG